MSRVRSRSFLSGNYLYCSRMTHSSYTRLEKTFRRISLVNEAAAVLHWDASVMMPPGGGNSRGQQLAELATITHGMLTAPDMSEWIADALSRKADLDNWQQANLAEMNRRWIRATALPEDLISTISIANSTCEASWREARPNNDFASVLPLLQDVLSLTREAGEALSAKLGVGIYDALLGDFEPGLSCDDVDHQFAVLESFLPEFLGHVVEQQKSGPQPILPEGPFPINKQRQLGVKMMEAIGFDFDNGRLDVSLHPFCGGTTEDIRITTRYDEGDFTSALMGVLHETGHAMYDRGLPKEWQHQPVGGSLGMSIHESQSLLVEMQVCRSREFLEFAAPIIRATFGGSGPAWEVDNLHRIYTRVKPDFIRVDADEVTYPAHIILRYRLEKAMLEDRLQLSDLPGAWNDGMKSLLGIVPPTDTLGCLQDVHWYDGAWAYFPTYSLGAISAAQLFAAAKSEDTTILPQISNGNFAPLMAWLGKNVHCSGALIPADQLLKKVTGKTLDATVFKNHLLERYSGK